jgi:hypothetical protein
MWSHKMFQSVSYARNNCTLHRKDTVMKDNEDTLCESLDKNIYPRLGQDSISGCLASSAIIMNKRLLWQCPRLNVYLLHTPLARGWSRQTERRRPTCGNWRSSQVLAEIGLSVYWRLSCLDQESGAGPMPAISTETSAEEAGWLVKDTTGLRPPFYRHGHSSRSLRCTSVSFSANHANPRAVPQTFTALDQLLNTVARKP